MRKVIFLIALITSCIFILSCSKKQTEQPISNNTNSQLNSNVQTQQLTPTPIINNSNNNDVTVRISTPTPFTASNNSILNNTKNNDDNVSDDMINKSVDNYLCSENEDVLFSFNVA